MYLLFGCITGVAFGRSGLIREVVCLEGNNLVLFYYLSASGFFWGVFSCLIRGMAFGGNGLIKRGGLSSGEQFSSILLYQWI